MSSDASIRIDSISKCFHMYDRPHHRLLQMLSFGRKQYFREFWALRDISFDVMRGETVGIVGRNGSGKSTLLQIVCGTLTPTLGQVQTSGRVAALLELGSGFNPEFTGRENVFLNAAVLGLTREEVEAKYDMIAAFADIGSFIDQPVRTYSSGMMVRLAFSVAINAEPRILVVDEALAVGDELFQRKCYSAIEKIKQDGATILLVSHSASAVVELCDRAVLVDAGKLLAIGNPKQVVGHYQKLLYAPESTREQVRAEVRARSVPGEPVTLLEEAPVPLDVEYGLAIVEHPETFDPALVSPMRFEYESHGVKISDPEIRSLDGRRVNNIVKRERYEFTYKVAILRPAANVRFAMLVKTTSGFPLGGALSAPTIPTSIPIVSAGEVYRVRFQFDCNLNPAVYFLNAGVFGDTGQGETVLHRIVDAVALRVQAVRENLSTEIVDFGFSAEIGSDE